MTDLDDAVKRLNEATLGDLYERGAYVRKDDIRTVLDALVAARCDSATGQSLHAQWQERAEAAEAERDALQARVDEALAACDKVLAVKVVGSSEGDAAAAGIAGGIRRILSTPSKEES